MFNQTGAGVFCMKETGRANLEEGFKAAGYSGIECLAAKDVEEIWKRSAGG
jgi:hypothetical protein